MISLSAGLDRQHAVDFVQIEAGQGQIDAYILDAFKAPSATLIAKLNAASPPLMGSCANSHDPTA